jgi:hypothetical protein
MGLSPLSGNTDKDRHEQDMPSSVIVLRVWHDSTPCTFENSRLGSLIYIRWNYLSVSLKLEGAVAMGNMDFARRATASTKSGTSLPRPCDLMGGTLSIVLDSTL